MKTPKLKPVASFFGAMLLTAIHSIAAPIITDPVDPQPIAIRDGLAATMTVTASSDAGRSLAYQWYKLNPAVAGREDDTPLSDGSGISGSKTRSLKITGAKASHTGAYYAVVYEPVGDPFPEAESPLFNLQVNVRPVIAANGQPVAQTVDQGEALNLTVGLTPETTLTDLTFQWQKNNVDIPVASNPTADDATFSIAAATVGNETTEGAQWPDAGTYRVKIVSPLTSTTIFSKPAVVKVNSQPVILVQPAAATGGTLYVANKAAGKLSVLAGGNPKLLYQWEKQNGTAETTDDDVLNAKASSLSVKEEGMYRVRVSNLLSDTPQGTLSSYAQVVVLNKPTEVGTIVASSNKSPAQPNAKGEFEANDVGGDTEVTLTVSPNLDDTGVLEFQWQKDGKNILNGDGVSGAQTAAIVLAPLKWTHRGVYRCVIKNKVGTYTSKTFALKVNSKPMLITPLPAEVVGVQDKSVTLSVVAGGNAPLTYAWYRESLPTTVIGKAAKLTLTKLSASSEGNYFCVITNSFGSLSTLTTPINVRVDVPVKFGSAPTGTTNVTVGNQLSLSVSTSQGDGPIQFQWQRGNVNLVNSPTVTGAQTTIASPNPAGETVFLTIDNISLTDAGSYRCIATNANGAVKVTSAAVKVSVLTAPFIQVGGQPESKEVYEDSNVTFTVKAGGSPALKYQWEKAATAAGPWTQLAGKTATTLALTKVQVALVNGDQGFYRCVVNNTTGVPATSDAAELKINLIPDPVITSFTPHKARSGEKIRVTGDELQFVSEVRFKDVDTGIKVVPVKEPGGTLIVAVPPGLVAGEEVELFVKSKNGFDGSGAETFSRSNAQINDRNNPSVIVGSTFPATQGATTTPLPGPVVIWSAPEMHDLPATGLGEAVYTWVCPKAGRYGFIVNSGFQVWLGISYGTRYTEDYTLFNRVHREEIIVAADNTPVTIYVFGVSGTAGTVIGSALPDYGSFALQVAYQGPVVPAGPAPVPVTTTVANWQAEGGTADLNLFETAEGEEKTSFTGSSAEGAQPTVLWTDASEVQAGPNSVVRTEWTMDIDQAGAGAKGHFGWQVTGANGAPLGQLQFSVEDGAIYVVQPDGTRTAAEPALVPGSSHRFEITTDLGAGTWQARMDGVAISEPLALPAKSGFGDVSVVWYPASGSAQPTMTFDGVTVTVD